MIDLAQKPQTADPGAAEHAPIADAQAPSTGFRSTGPLPPVATGPTGAAQAASPSPSPSDRAFGASSDPGPTAIDGGELGQSALVDSAVARAHVELAQPAEAVVTSVDSSMTPTFAVTATVPLAQIQPAGVPASRLAQLTDVHRSVGPGGGTVTHQIVGDAVQITLSGIAMPALMNLTQFKLFYASGDTVMLDVHASAFHVDNSEYERADLRDQIAGDQRYEDQLRGADNAPGSATPAAGDPQIAEVQQRIVAAQAKLAALQGPSYVTLDEHGFPLATPKAPR